MATLIQSKQIEGVVTASVIQGDFLVSGSLVVTGSGIFTSDITASSISSSGPIYGVRYSDVQGTPDFVAGSGIVITQVGTTITITNTGGGGEISGSAELISSVAQLNSYTGSNDIIILGLEQFTASIQSDLDSLETRVSVLESQTDNTGSDSQTLSIVGDQLTISDGNTITIPSGGGSTDISALNDFTSSTDSRLSSLESATASLQSQIDGIVHTQIPEGTISSSQQILDLGFVTSSGASGEHTDISALNAYTSSNDETITELQTRIDGLSAATSSYLTSETDNQTLSIVGDQLTISDGNTITIPTGSGGGTTDISSLNQFTESIQSQVDSLTSATASYLTELPSGVFSGSILPGTNVTIDSSSGDYIISASLVGGGDTSFDGNKIVSNTLLGDLYSQSFNAGTSGSIQDFLTAVFFPSEAPTATFTNQTANFNTNLATNNTNLVSVSLTDTVDNSPYTLVLSGTNASSFTAVPTNAESSSWEIRANGDLTAGTYSYNVVVGDSTNAERTYSGRSITIAQATAGTLSTTGTLYIIESATSGPIYLSSTGRIGTQGGVIVSYSPNYGSQVAANFSSTNSLISVNSTTGVLSVGSSISGSGNLSGDTITSTISWEDQYGNTDSDTISVNVTTNFAPTRSATTTTNNNTNQATGSAQIIRLTVTDTESDSIPNSGLVWEGYNSTYFTPSVTSPYMDLSANNTSIPAGVYPFTASFSDVHGFRTSSYSSSVTINQADNGTLGGDINNYIIESALSGSVLRDQTGFNAGNVSQVTVSYSPSYGSPLVQSFTSSNPAIVISNTGHLTLAVDLSGSVTQSGATINSTIGWEDQYGNVDSSAINVTVFGNQSPAASFTDLGLNTETAVSGSHIGTLTITDTETNTPFSASIGGTDGGKFEIVPQNANSSSYYVYPTGSLSQGDYSVQFVVTDNYSETATLNETISVSAATDYGTIYVYTQNLGPAGAWSTAQYKGIYGISVENGDTPPEVTSFTAATSMLGTLVNNDVIGDSTITFASTYTMTLRDTISGDTTLDSALASNGNISFAGTANILLLYPSGSDMEVPTSIQESINGTAGGAVPYLNADGGGWGVAGAKLNSITLGTPHLGYSEWFVLGRLGTDGVGSSFEYRLINANGGSAPS